MFLSGCFGVKSVLIWLWSQIGLDVIWGKLLKLLWLKICNRRITVKGHFFIKDYFSLMSSSLWILTTQRLCLKISICVPVQYLTPSKHLPCGWGEQMGNEIINASEEEEYNSWGWYYQGRIPRRDENWSLQWRACGTEKKERISELCI